MAKHAPHILELARKGAEVTYKELQEELAALVRHFPHLRQGRRTAGNGAAAVAGAAPVRKRAKMSAAAKKAVSLRMKKYWAERRAAKGKK